MWSILDTGSGITAADHQKHFPGAVLRDLDQKGHTFHTATGEPFSNKGRFDVGFRTENRNEKEVTFENAKVAIPIISMHDWNARGHRTTLDEDYGDTVHEQRNAHDAILVRSGVYFLKMFVRKKLVNGA